MSNWESVFEIQMELWKFWQSPRGKAFGQGFIEDCNKKKKGYESLNGILPEFETRRLWQAEPIYVAPEMMELLEIAMEGFEPEPLLPSDLITPSGFMVLPKPFHVIDVHDQIVAWRAMLWHPLTIEWEDDKLEGIFLSIYSHIDDPDEVGYPDVARTMPTKYSLTHIAPWSYYSEIPEDDKARQVLRQIQCFFRLTMQHITTHDKYPIPRSSVRRAKRLKFQDRNVTVIRLRRPKTKPQSEGEPINYTHRFLVRGHWRNQWFPSLNTHRQIYIHEFIKGPEDKPLRISDRRAFELVK